MDDYQVIKMMAAFFKKLADQGPQDESGRRANARKVGGITDQFVEWYEKNACKQKDLKATDKFSGAPIADPIPETTGIGVLKEYEKEMMPILADFNKKCKLVAEVRNYFDSYVDKIREGWGAKLAQIREKTGK